MHIRAPIWLRAAGTPGARSFATLFAFESAARAILATVIVVDVQRLTGSAAATSLVFFAVALFGLCTNFGIVALIRRFGRRWVYSGGGLCLIVASVLMMQQELVPQVAGMALRVFGVICFNICLNLYILDSLKGQQINRLEPLKLFMAAIPWSFGPAAGVWMADSQGHDLPYLFSIAVTVVLLGFFWFLRTKDDSPLPIQKRPPPRPLRSLVAFFSSPRLRLCYVIAITRSTFWSMYFVYGPLYCIEVGLGAQTGGYLVSAGNAFLFIAPVMGWVARKMGIRRMIVGAFALSAAACFGAFAFAALPWTAALLLLIGAYGAFLLDVTGNVPFLRMVKPSERQSMTPIFATYREFSDTVPPGVFALLLLQFKLPVVFLVTGLWQLLAALYSLKLPKRL